MRDGICFFSVSPCLESHSEIFPINKHSCALKIQLVWATLPPTQPTVGTNLTDLTIQRVRITVREVGGSMGPIWPSYYQDCRAVLFVVDSANPMQVSASCIQLLSVLSAPALSSASVLIIFNKTDLPCCMSLVEMKSLFRMDDIISSSQQPITVMETSALEGTGLQEVLQWLHSSIGA